MQYSFEASTWKIYEKVELNTSTSLNSEVLFHNSAVPHDNNEQPGERKKINTTFSAMFYHFMYKIKMLNAPKAAVFSVAFKVTNHSLTLQKSDTGIANSESAGFWLDAWHMVCGDNKL